MITKTRQRVVTAGLLIVAGVALVLAATYQGERLPDGPNVVGAGASNSGATVAGPVNGGVTNPIEGWFPRSGAGSGCREPVGVDLIGGYGATLTVNGVAIDPAQMNVTLDEEGRPTEQITASRSLGHYTFGPEVNCPNDKVLRATDNLIQACVYQLIEGPDGCVIAEFRFDLA